MVEYVPENRRGCTMEERKRKRLTAKRKFEIYLETRQEGAKIGEVLRREGIHLDDLREIEELVERGAVGALKSKGPGRAIRRKIDPLEYDQVKRELHEKERAMSDLMVEHMLLKKSEELASRGRLKGRTSGTGENDGRSSARSKKRKKQG